MATESAGVDLPAIVILLGAAVVAVPLFKRAGLGSVLGYLAAGLAIGPFGAGLFADPMAILHVAELGVVMFLFIIGLKMQPSRLWSLRRDIFGLGLAQVLLSMGLLSLVGLALGYPFAPALVAGTGFVLTSTAIVMQMLEERGDISAPRASGSSRSCFWKTLPSSRFWPWSPFLPRAARPSPSRFCRWATA